MTDITSNQWGTNMRILLAILMAISPVTGYAQTTGRQLEFNSAWGVAVETNLVKNPSAAKNAANVTTSSATATQDISAGNKVDGIASWLIDTAATAGYVEFDLDTTPDDLTSGNCMAGLVFKGDGTLYSLQVLDNFNNPLLSVPLQNNTGWSPLVTANLSCAASGARKVRITQTTAGTSPAINVGRVYYGRATNVGQGVPNNVFSAKVAANGTVTDETEDFISGNFTNTNPFVGTFVSGKFNVTPNCVVAAASNASATNAARIDSASITTITVQTTSTAAATQVAFNITCTRAGSDFIQPTITPNQWNYGDVPYTPTFTNLGTVTTQAFTHSRIGNKLKVKFRFNAASGGASAASVSLPPGLVISSTGNVIVGAAWSSATTSKDLFVNAANGATIVSFTANNGAGGALTGTDFGTSIVDGWFEVSIQGWTENQNAPQLVGSVTSNASGALRIERFDIGGASAGTICSGTCTIYNSTSSGFTAVRNSLGNYTISFLAGMWSSAPACFYESFNGTNVIISSAITATTTLAATLITSHSAGGGILVDTYTYVTCIGPR